MIFAAAALLAYAAWPLANANLPLNAMEKKLSQDELLGKRIFEDASLSNPPGLSCASCHEPRKAFQGNNGSLIPAIASGSSKGHFGTRNTPTIMYMAQSPAFHFAAEKNELGETEYVPTGGQFWDGRADDFASQASGPMLGEREMNGGSKPEIVQKIVSGKYAQLASDVIGSGALSNTDAAFDKITAALAAFENTAQFAPFASKFDDYLRGKMKLSAAEQRGFDLFKNPEKGNCISCHVGDEKSKNPADWIFTDYTYDNLGVPRNPAIPENAQADHFDLGLCDQPGIDKKLPDSVTRQSLCGAFKVPTLRNVAVTAPYMHNGAFQNLRDVVKFYATRDTNPELWHPKNANGPVRIFDDLPAKYHANVNTSEAPYDRKIGEQPRLNDAEIDDIVAFLGTLTDRNP